ncbi:unannotated protein [freshwater metagenome]|uniref:Unannotated protein n=1 Tax=freshwater metagenome TaxID=449393 RepID=A0A6J7S8C0_9ZZZZ
MNRIGRAVIALGKGPPGVRDPKEFKVFICFYEFVEVLDESIKFLCAFDGSQTKGRYNIESYLRNNSESAHTDSGNV